MAFKDGFLKVLHGEPESLYEAFVQLSRKALPPDADARYLYLRSPQGKYIARDDADVDVYTVRVAQKHIPKFKWLYDGLFREYPNVFSKDLDLVVWGCGCGLDLLAFYDRALEQKNPQLWTKVRHVTLVDMSSAALARAKQITEMLFPLATVNDVQCDLAQPAEIIRKVVLRHLTAYLPRIHLISNLLDLFDDVRPFAEAVKKCAVRDIKTKPYFNELVVAFSPDYQKGKVALKVATFRSTWNLPFSKDVRSVGDGPENCEFCTFSCSTLAGMNDRCYRSYLGGNNHVLSTLVAKCPTVESGLDFHKFVSTLAGQKVLGMDFFRAYRWVEVSRNKHGVIDRFIFVPDPKLHPRPAPCVVEWIPVGDNRDMLRKSAEHAIRDLRKRRGDEDVTIEGKKDDVSVLCWDGEKLAREDLDQTKDSDPTNDSDQTDVFWTCDERVDYSLYFRVDPDGAEPLPNLEGSMDDVQREIIYSRSQYRKIRGGAGCGKSTTMMWHAVISVLQTHLPVLLVCKTVTLFSRNARRIAATLLQEVQDLEYVDSDLIRFMTLDKVLCEHVKKRGFACQITRCGRCKGGCGHDPVADCKDFQAVAGRGRNLGEVEKEACCNACVESNMRNFSRKGSRLAEGSPVYGALMIDEVQSVNPDLVQAVVNLSYSGNPSRQCYVFCDERQCLNPEAVEIDPEKRKLRVKVPDRGVGYGRWTDLNKPYRTSLDFTGRLSDVAVKLQALMVEKYGTVELTKFIKGGQMTLSSAVAFSVRRSSEKLLNDVLTEISALTAQGADSITVVCDDADDVRSILQHPETRAWTSTHLPKKSHVEEQKLRKAFREKQGGVQLTTVTLAQGWDFSSVVYVCTSDIQGADRNVLENVLTGATRATSFMRILDRSSSGWLYETLKELN